MDQNYVQIAGYISAFIFALIIIFQILITMGMPLGEYTMGGVHKGALPKRWRIISLISVFVLLFFALTILQETLIPFEFQLLSPGVNTVFVWLITIYLGLNTIANFFSKSNKERNVMTPLSFIAFLSYLYILIFS